MVVKYDFLKLDKACRTKILNFHMMSFVFNFFQFFFSAKEFSSISIDSITVKSPRQELQSVISQIERENRYRNFILVN